ncbi:MAG TPA: FAD-dependent oxidoreductase [Euzebyales bacterium]
MGRTPLFRFTVRALQRARQLNLEAAGQPAAVQRPGYRVSRRQFLKSGATAAAAAGLATTTGGGLVSARAMDPPRIAIVGGGLAGLNAALWLQDLRIDATVYEARDRVGGRCYSRKLVHDNTEYVLDYGGSFINSDHADMLALIDRYELRDELFDRVEDADDQPYQAEAYYFDGKLIPEATFATDLQAIAEQISRDAALLDQNWSKWASRFDALSVADYLDQHADKLTAPGTREVLEQANRSEYGSEPRDSSALQLLFLLPVADGEHVEILGYSDEKYVLEGGIGRLPDAMAAELGDRVQLGRVLTRVEDRMSTYMLTFADGEVVEVDAVIVTVPASLLRTIEWTVTLPSQFRRYIRDIDLGRNEKTFVGFTPRIWRTQQVWTNGMWVDGSPLPGPDKNTNGYCVAWEATQREGPDAPSGAVTFYFGGAQVQKNRTSVRDLARSLYTIIPGDADDDTHNGFSAATDWANEEFTRGAYINFKPGQLTTYGQYFWIENELSVAFRNLVFAGEHFSDLWYGFMNGGAETGRLAANYVANRLPPG